MDGKQRISTVLEFLDDKIPIFPTDPLVPESGSFFRDFTDQMDLMMPRFQMHIHELKTQQERRTKMSNGIPIWAFYINGDPLATLFHPEGPKLNFGFSPFCFRQLASTDVPETEAIKTLLRDAGLSVGQVIRSLTQYARENNGPDHLLSTSKKSIVSLDQGVQGDYVVVLFFQGFEVSQNLLSLQFSAGAVHSKFLPPTIPDHWDHIDPQGDTGNIQELVHNALIYLRNH